MRSPPKQFGMAPPATLLQFVAAGQVKVLNIELGVVQKLWEVNKVVLVGSHTGHNAKTPGAV